MSIAKRCDRCKSFYSFEDETGLERAEFLNIKYHGNGKLDSLCLLSLRNRNDETIRYIDLCPECTQSFKNWVERRTENE